MNYCGLTKKKKKKIKRNEAINHRRIILELQYYKNNALSFSLFPFKTINDNRPIFIYTPGVPKYDDKFETTQTSQTLH
jgi:hypothetical protein